MREREKDVIKTLSNPDIIRQSGIDKNVYLFYRRVIYDKKQYYLCVVVNNSKGFLITAYITNKVKEGELVWKK